MKKILFLVFYIFTALLYSSSVPEALDLSIPNKNIGKNLAFFEDTSGEMSLAQIKNLSLNEFTPLNKNVATHLFTTSAFWYRFEVRNNKSTPLSRLIIFGIPWLDSIKIAVIDHNGKESIYEGGDTFAYEKRALNHTFPNFSHEFAPGYSTVYIQIKTRDPFIVPISITDQLTFLEEAATESNQTGFIYGIIVGMLFYNLFIFLSIRVRFYAFYVLYLSAFLITNASYRCFTFEWLFYDNPTVQNWAESTTIFLFNIIGLFFTQSFLNLKKHFPILHRMTNSIILIFIGMMIVTPIMGYHYHVMVAVALTVVFSLYAFSIAFYSLFKGYRYALFFLLGTSAGLIGSSITALTVMALIPYSDIGFKAVDYGMAIDAILLSLALGERVRMLQDEKLTAQLEAKTDELTGLFNRRAYDEITLNEVHRCQRYGGELSLIMLDIDYFKNINDTFGHAAGDQVLLGIVGVLKSMLREYDYAFRIGGEEFMVVLPETGGNHAAHLAERLRIAIENMSVLYFNHTISTTVSLGITEYRIDEMDIKEAQKRVDEALYAAKEAGRNQISVKTQSD
ncbi:MAG: diguanylate cyclase [Sulfuricurvum sp.]|nr:diguanylate cyclase [Sulfuricurvum sp.]